MSGESALNKLITGMQPVLQPPTYVFVTLAEGQEIPAICTPRMQFIEEEGTTLIIERQQAEGQGWDYDFPCRMITLNIHSSLEAVGFLASITRHLARLGMGVNPVSGYFHDHLFIPEHRAEEALKALQAMCMQGPYEYD